MSCGDWTLYDLETGQLRGTFSGPAAALEVNTPPGCAAIEGLHDGERCRVDLESREVIEHRPDQLSPRHQWDADSHRWVAPIEERRAAAAAREAQASINAAELRALRAMREGLLELLPADSPARHLLNQVDSEIASRRPKIKRG